MDNSDPSQKAQGDKNLGSDAFDLLFAEAFESWRLDVSVEVVTQQFKNQHLVVSK